MSIDRAQLQALGDKDLQAVHGPNAARYNRPIRCKRLYASAKLPTRAHANDAGLDLYVHSEWHNGAAHIIGTGVAIEIPAGHLGLICPRSSINLTEQITKIGVIDSGYVGEITVAITDNLPIEYESRIAQLVIIPCLLGPVVEEDFAGGERGTSGFGSTGR